MDNTFLVDQVTKAVGDPHATVGEKLDSEWRLDWQVRAVMQVVDLLKPVDLVAFAMDHHDLENACGCHGTPGADCSQWCKACKVLAGLPPEVLEAATAKRTADEIERSR